MPYLHSSPLTSALLMPLLPLLYSLYFLFLPDTVYFPFRTYPLFLFLIPVLHITYLYIFPLPNPLLLSLLVLNCPSVHFSYNFPTSPSLLSLFSHTSSLLPYFLSPHLHLILPPTLLILPLPFDAHPPHSLISFPSSTYYTSPSSSPELPAFTSSSTPHFHTSSPRSFLLPLPSPSYFLYPLLPTSPLCTSTIRKKVRWMHSGRKKLF